MKSLQFKPLVFRVTTLSSTGDNVWDLLTVDGETPCNTVYFMLKGDAPSSSCADQIQDKIERGEYEVMTLEDSENELSDFSVDMKLFETAGFEAYGEIREELNKTFC